jgi:riboflavin biosynthesis pyrimidine reductase
MAMAKTPSLSASILPLLNEPGPSAAAPNGGYYIITGRTEGDRGAVGEGYVYPHSAVRQLIPAFIDPVDPLEVYGRPSEAAGRLSVRLNMIASADGASAVSGVSRGLSGPGDHKLFLLLRSLADVILVGAGTARAERYGPARISADLQADRRGRGQAAVPPIAVVTRSCRLDWDSPLFADATARPIVVTVSAAAAADRAAAAQVADLVLAGDRDVELGSALAALRDRGARSVLAEGGPTLNGDLTAAGLVDELCLTISPLLLGGPANRILAGAALPSPTGLRLASVCEEDGFVFLRYLMAT